MKTFKILGLLLSYPEANIISHLKEMERMLKQEELLPGKQLQAILRFMDYLTNTDLLALQEDYVDTFDRGRAHCLHLFEHVYGESRDRGQAMVDLKNMYETKGLYLDTAELPDYLPLFLEYLSHCDLTEAKSLLAEPIAIIAAIGAKLKKRKSPYYRLFTVLQTLSEIKADEAIIKAAMKTEKTETLETLDQEWEEPPAFGATSDAEACRACNSFPKATETLRQFMEGA